MPTVKMQLTATCPAVKLGRDLWRRPIGRGPAPSYTPLAILLVICRSFFSRRDRRVLGVGSLPNRAPSTGDGWVAHPSLCSLSASYSPLTERVPATPLMSGEAYPSFRGCKCKEWQVRLIKVATIERARIGKGVRFQPGLGTEVGEGRSFSTP
jgi:hypothetical protein